MAPGFSFPPPPPPPPKASLPDPTNDYSSTYQHDDRGSRGRGSRGGRGGRGYSYSSGGSRGGYHQNNPNLVQPNTSYVNNLPGGAYINPAFQPSYDTHAIQNHSFEHQRSDQTSFRGQKRKRDPGENWRHDQGSNQTNSPHPMKKPENRPKVQVAPAVPSFGSPLFSSNATTLPATVTKAKPHVEARKTHGSLGLISRGEDEISISSESEDEDVDEEALFQATSTGPLTFEYNGEVAKLETQADIKAWIEERKRLWPSKKRIEQRFAEKQARIDERRRIEAETRALTTGKHQTHSGTLRKVSNHDSIIEYSGHRNEAEDVTATLERQTREIDQLKRKLAERESAVQMAQGEDGHAADIPGAVFANDVTQTQHEHEDGNPAMFENNDNGSESDDDSAPEVESSKASAKTKAFPQHAPSICRVFASTGRCKFGANCHYQHVGTPRPESQGPAQKQQKPSSSTGRKSLFDQLVEKEQSEDDALALQAIKYLGGIGFFRQIQQ